MTQKMIAVLVGSLRKESFNRKMARALTALAPESLKLEIIEIGGLPLYNEDLEDNPPASWGEFRERLIKFDGVLFVTPEYNRSVPGVLKNAIDVGFPSLWKKRVGWKTGSRNERLTWRNRRIWRKSPPAPIDGVLKCSHNAAA